MQILKLLMNDQPRTLMITAAATVNVWCIVEPGSTGGPSIVVPVHGSLKGADRVEGTFPSTASRVGSIGVNWTTMLARPAEDTVMVRYVGGPTDR